MRPSWLFAPGNRPAVVAKAMASPAQAVILDLEDAVPEGDKPVARAALAGMIDRAHPALFVRINALSTPYALDDIVAVAGLPVAGVMLPKAERASDIVILDWLLGQAGGKAQCIIPLIETATGIAHCREIAGASSRNLCLAFGAADYTLDLGMRWSRDEAELTPARSALVVASRVAGLDPPLDAVWTDIADAAGLLLSAQRAADHGFQGKMCIHPSQLASVQEAFRPTAQAIAQARRIVGAFEEAGGAGVAAVQFEGRMVDLPVLAHARRIIAAAEAEPV